MPHTICVVDDDEMSEKMLTLILKIEKYSVISASSGKAAVELLDRNTPDLILLDIDMPEMTGLELIQILKTKPHLKEVPVIFISSHNDIDTKVEGLRLGAIDFISKPFQNPEVITRVKVHLENGILSKQLKELNNKKNTFFSIIAKNMNEDLDEIYSRIISLQDMIEANDLKAAKEVISKLNKLNNRTKSYLRNLIYWSRLETDMIHLNSEKVNVSKILNEITKEYTESIQLKKIILENTLAQKEEFALADEYSIHIILENLFSNAIKFTNYHEFIKINSSRSGDRITFSIINKGMFFTQAMQEKIFNFEYKSNQSFDDSEKGSGLGLALSKELVEKNGGKFWITTDENITEISFSLPV
ncbi:MAG: hybrid sensor histidine kinase/response regulator [Leptospiraceae bacterium]|nr:hybrid sensor histidine kinase/response regulator [Leptospiraceae bacterium]